MIKTDDTATIIEQLKIYTVKGINIKDVEDKAALFAKDDFPGFKIKYGYGKKV